MSFYYSFISELILLRKKAQCLFPGNKKNKNFSIRTVVICLHFEHVNSLNTWMPKVQFAYKCRQCLWSICYRITHTTACWPYVLCF